MRKTLVALAVLVVAAGAAQAKVPGFGVEVVPESPVAGEPFEIVVQLEQSMPVQVFTSLLGFYRADSPDRIQNLSVFRTGGKIYSRTLTIDEPGEWVIIAFPNRTGWPVDQVPEGYPDRIPLTVRPGLVTGRLIGWGLLLALLGLAAFRLIVSDRGRLS